MKVYLFLSALILSSSVNVFAASHYSVVTSVGAYNSQWGVFNIETPIPSENGLPGGCTVRRSTISFDKSTPHGRDMLSIILTAFSTGKKLHIQHFTSTCGADDIYPLANRVDVLRD
jgi:hypothetical protein